MKTKKYLKVKDHKKFACFEYTSRESLNFELGDVVKKVSEDGIEIGVILQIHDNEEFRTDQFGNGHISEIKKATLKDIKEFRPDILKELI